MKGKFHLATSSRAVGALTPQINGGFRVREKNPPKVQVIGISLYFAHVHVRVGNHGDSGVLCFLFQRLAIWFGAYFLRLKIEKVNSNFISKSQLQLVGFLTLYFVD